MVRRAGAAAAAAGLAALAAPGVASAHAVEGADAAFVSGVTGPAPAPFAYLGAKHMVTGYDHILFLVGVIFFLRRLPQIALYATLFSVGHSITLLTGVLGGWRVDEHLVDAAIGFSVAYKAFDNLGGMRTVFRWQPDLRAAVFGFGLIHGLGLATKLQALGLNRGGLAINLVSFNVGVEIGQLVALTIVLAVMTLWRRSRSFEPAAVAANVLLMLAGFVLTGQQLAGFAFGESHA